MPEKLCEWWTRSLWRQECKDEESIKRHWKRFYFVKDTDNPVMRSEQRWPCVDCCGDLYHGVLKYLLLEKHQADKTLRRIKDEGSDDYIKAVSNVIHKMSSFIDSIIDRELEEEVRRNK